MSTSRHSPPSPPSAPSVRPYSPADRDDVVALWSACGLVRPWNHPVLDIERKLAQDPAGFLVIELEDRVRGSVMAGYDGHRGWVNYLAVDPAHRRSGLGRLLMAAAEHHLAGLGCPKVNLQVRTDNEQAVAFYHRLGYGVDDVVSMGKRLADDTRPLTHAVRPGDSGKT